MSLSKSLLRLHAKSDIFFRSLRKHLSGSDMGCPSCGSADGKVIDRRFIVFSLVRCASCGLLSRRPADTGTESERFYQLQYIEETVTDLPTAEELRELLASGFKAQYSYALPIRLLKQLGFSEGTKIVDFGCNWGYGAWQFREAGMAVTPIEISAPRADYARQNLALNVLSRLDELDSNASFDVFFSSHVLEHVANISEVLKSALSLVRPGGLFIAITPNGADAFRKSHPARWHELWGRKHSNFLDEVFWKQTLQNWGYFIMSRSEDGSVQVPWDQLSRNALLSKAEGSLAGEELIVVAIKPQ